ncbi:hypothetical protein PF005_g1330 [Phytophthora fragariae]|uniref:Secreted protein n=1 Tax=Phytophthora fragariae TaxID=53985 RepID=A0A6A3TQF6_9STRA|nr:hypothetical protein PF003_g25976 [Phytophthora fragariae]KAE8949100.1 hypothetical protein PF009_g1357 [Phytophthora fragariae]KAE9015457.1 hypothetical protein PF011_g7594 [Phytophthora fragariae]KAE9138124.1 hypothetical protein PF010_g1061 [Phytophthora fragariae]KAE9138797.1 hypothetical protein PF007_g1259 [Phytophthora fragariae]
MRWCTHHRRWTLSLLAISCATRNGLVARSCDALAVGEHGQSCYLLVQSGLQTRWVLWTNLS